MRFILILVGVGTIGYFAVKKTWESFTMKDVKETSLAAAKVKSPLAITPPAVQSGPVPGGSIATSIQKSLDFSSPSQAAPPPAPLVSRVVEFQYRSLPAPETFSALTSLGINAVVDTKARLVFLRGPFDVVKEVGDMLQASDLVPGFCSMRGWVIWVSDADLNGWEFTAELGANLSLADDWNIAVGTSDVLLSAGIQEVTGALRLMSTDSRITVVQEPHVRLTDGVESRIESLEEVPIPETTLSNGIASESITYKRVGLELVVTPTFLPGGRVRLSVVQIGGVVGRTVQIKDAEIPVLQTQKVASDIELAVGQSLVLGGVRSVRTKKARGWFNRSDEVETGVLYVVVSLYHDAPKARPVTAPEWESSMDQIILETDLPWLTDGEVLPSKPSK